MRFLADENIPDSIKRLLGNLKHEILDIKSLSKRQTPDPNVIELAKKYKAIIITFDSEFGVFYTFAPEKFDVILLRSKPFDLEKIKVMLKEFLLAHNKVQGLYIVSNSGVRRIFRE